MNDNVICSVYISTGYYKLPYFPAQISPHSWNVCCEMMDCTSYCLMAISIVRIMINEFQSLTGTGCNCIRCYQKWKQCHQSKRTSGNYFSGDMNRIQHDTLMTAITALNKEYHYTVYPKKYAHGFVVLCFVVVMQSFIMNSHEVFIHIHRGCFAGTGAIVRLPQCQWSKPDGYGKISQCITTTKHSKAKTVCILLGIYCSCCRKLQVYEPTHIAFHIIVLVVNNYRYNPPLLQYTSVKSFAEILKWLDFSLV